MNFINGESVWLNSDNKIRIIHTTYITFRLGIFLLVQKCHHAGLGNWLTASKSLGRHFHSKFPKPQNLTQSIYQMFQLNTCHTTKYIGCVTEKSTDILKKDHRRQARLLALVPDGRPPDGKLCRIVGSFRYRNYRIVFTRNLHRKHTLYQLTSKLMVGLS